MKRRAIVQGAALTAIAPGMLLPSRTGAAGAHRRELRQNASAIPDTMFLGNPAHTGGQPGPGPAGVPVDRWRFESERRITSTPLVAGGVLYVGGVDKRFTALDAATGTLSWQVDLGAPIAGSPGMADGLIITGTSDAASGERRWRYEVGAAARTSPLVSGGFIFVGGETAEGTGVLLALGDPER